MTDTEITKYKAEKIENKEIVEGYFYYEFHDRREKDEIIKKLQPCIQTLINDFSFYSYPIKIETLQKI
jgi:hypothetical protein